MILVASVAELETAITSAKAGDDIVLADGTYAVDHKITCAAAGTPAAPITVRAANPLGAHIEANTLEAFSVTGAGWHFEGLDLRGVCTSDDSCEHAFHVTGHATGFVLRRSRIQDFSAQLKVNAALGAGGAWEMPHDGLVEYCEVFDTHARNTSAPVTKLNIDTGDRWIVRGNYIHDFHKASATPTYGAFMKSGGKSGLFERNLVVCLKDEKTAGVHIGLSFGGGGTGAQYCAPAFDASVPCDVEHDGGTMRNNIIAACSDVGIYLNRAKGSRLLHNTLVGTTGIDFRFPTTSGEARANVLASAIRTRDGAQAPTLADNLVDLTQGDFDAMYMAPLAGDLRKKGDLARLLGKSAGPGVSDDYCARARTAPFDLGALQHSLGDCDTTRPPEPAAAPDAGTDAGPSAPSAGGGSDGGGDPGSAASPGADGGDEGSSGCTCTLSRRERRTGALGLVVAAALALTLARRRR